jgi:hypothetical protein
MFLCDFPSFIEYTQYTLVKNLGEPRFFTWIVIALAKVPTEGRNNNPPAMPVSLKGL